MATLREEVWRDLCKWNPRRNPHDIAAAWHNASRWFVQLGVLPQHLQDGVEPAEVTAARTLYVRWAFEDLPEDKSQFNFAMWTLLEPFTAVDCQR